VQVGPFRPEELALVIDSLAVPETADQPAGLLERGELVSRQRPIESERRLVQGLAGAEADENSARIHRLERREALRNECRVVALQRNRDRRPDGHALRRLGRSTEPDPGLTGMAGHPPGLEVVGAGDAVETRVLARNGLVEQRARVVLLVHTAEEVTGHFSRLPRLHKRETMMRPRRSLATPT